MTRFSPCKRGMGRPRFRVPFVGLRRGPLPAVGGVSHRGRARPIAAAVYTNVASPRLNRKSPSIVAYSFGAWARPPWPRPEAIQGTPISANTKAGIVPPRVGRPRDPLVRVRTRRAVRAVHLDIEVLEAALSEVGLQLSQGSFHGHVRNKADVHLRVGLVREDRLRAPMFDVPGVEAGDVHGRLEEVLRKELVLREV